MIALALLAWLLVSIAAALLVGNAVKVADRVEAACKRDAAQRAEWDVLA